MKIPSTDPDRVTFIVMTKASNDALIYDGNMYYTDMSSTALERNIGIEILTLHTCIHIV